MLSVSRCRFRWLGFTAALLLLCASNATGQTLGSIQGYVLDSSGAPLPGVSVSAKNTETGAVRTAQTNSAGFFSAPSMASGRYDVTASLDGFQSVRQESVRLQVGQTISLNLELGVAEVTEVITVTSEAPLLETSRSSTASYVSEEEIEALPIIGRDFTDFALLTPTVQADTDRGFITMSGQRGIYTGLNIDGTSAKSAFFGYGRGGEATENDGLVIAQDSVKEFQVVTSSFAPEYGANGGGFVNVITKSGTNKLKGTGFFFFQDDSMADDIPATPLDESRGNGGDREVSQFEKLNYGLSIGGPISKDKTHFFFSYDQTNRDEPITRSLRTAGVYDALIARGFDQLVEGYTRNADGTAEGIFNREVDNQILFAKIDHQINDRHALSARINLTDYERLSTFRDEESNKTEDTTSLVAAVVSLVGQSSVNEFRIQLAEDNLDRLSLRVGEPIEAQIRFRFGSRDSVGKFDFLPIFVEEEKLQVQDNFSYLFGNHDLKFGVDYQEDNLSQLFKGSADGRYDFRSLEDFMNNEASNVRIYFGNITNPNYDETQSLLGIYAQDSYKPNARLSVNFGFRYGATYNPDNLEHLFPEGRDIPDDTNNFAPRLGFAYTLGENGVLRGGAGLFYGRTPSLLFASQIQQNGLFPNFGRVNVQPGDIGFVPLGTSIDNQNPPLDAPNSPAYVDPSYEDSETTRLNLGYERNLGGNWTAGVDVVYAEGDMLGSNVELNRTLDRLDEFGRPVYSSTRPNSDFNEIFTRQSISESEYKAVTFKVNKRFSDKYQMQAHYTWSKDESNDDNERSATGIDISNPADLNYDYGLSDRDVENRFVLSGLYLLPWDIRISGIFEYRSGRPYTAVDDSVDFAYCGFGRLGFNCPDVRAVINGQVVERNSFRNESINRIDLRVSKFINLGTWKIDLFGEAFNLLDENSFAVTGFDQRDPNQGEFGIAGTLVTTPRTFQIGARISFN